jgi:hypothetical protein
MKLESWLHSIPRSRTWSESFRVECLGPLEMEKMSFSTRRVEWPREREIERAIGIVEVFIELKKLAIGLRFKFWTKSSVIGQCLVQLDKVR